MTICECWQAMWQSMAPSPFDADSSSSSQVGTSARCPVVGSPTMAVSADVVCAAKSRSFARLIALDGRCASG